MLMLPIKNLRGRDTLVVILGPDNVERMKQADPVEITSFGGKVLNNPQVFICYEEQTPELERFVQSGDLGKLLEHLGRGFKFRPEMGDHDRGPERLTGFN